MKILLYNYVLPNEPRSPGRGVTKYLQSLIVHLIRRNHQVFVLGSGDRYSLFPAVPSVSAVQGLANLVIYDSPVVSPAIYSFHHPSTQIDSTALDAIPPKIRDMVGPLNVIHYHNIEGLTHGFFKKMKDVFPESRIFLTAHNYNLVCPQVNLWRQDKEVCRDDEDSAACVSCQRSVDPRGRRRLVNGLKTKIKDLPAHLSALDRLTYAAGDRLAMKATDGTRTQNSSSNQTQSFDSAASHLDFRRLRKANIELCNSTFDRVLAVSNRTRNLLIDRGVQADRVDTLHIGTQYYDKLNSSPKKIPVIHAPNIGYLGYMDLDKGFYYFLAALEVMPLELSRSFAITVAARFTDMEAVRRLEKIQRNFREFHLHDGYSHDEYPKVLSKIDLGIIPSIREDNFPLVALELVCQGIPILTSDRGGAREIASDDRFTFGAEDPSNLVALLRRVCTGEVDMKEFWNQPLRVSSVAAHVDELINQYYLGANN